MIPRVMHISRDVTLMWQAGMDANIHTSDALRAASTPGGADTLPTLLARLNVVAQKCDMDEITVIIAADMLPLLHLPPKPPTKGGSRNAALESARAHHWEVGDIGKWMSFRRPGTSGRKRAVHIGVEPWLSERNFPLWHNDAGVMISLLSAVQQLTGTAYRASPGVLGSAMLQDTWQGPQPMWHPNWNHCPPAQDHVTERAYTNWTPKLGSAGRVKLGDKYLHSYDQHRAYLAAAVGCEAAFGPLQPTASREFDRRTAGYWQVIVPVWNIDYLPHPMGPDRVPGAKVWTTTVTLALVEDLAKQGVIEMPRVLDAWVAPPSTGKPTTRRLLRTWATALDKAADKALDHPVLTHASMLEHTLKQAYKESIGMWVNETGRIWRPDVSHDVLGRSRCNGFRRAWAAAEAGHFPVRINVDEISYASDHDNPYTAAPPGFRITIPGDRARLGTFKLPHTEPIKELAWT